MTELTQSYEKGARTVSWMGPDHAAIGFLMMCKGDSMTNITENRNFDLNIEKVLEGWEICHAIRELIANALDEQMLTQTTDGQIYRDPDGVWHIRDFGRGLKYEHLTQNESKEKLNNPSKVIGKFGVGLKDALATLNRRGVEVCIHSRFGDITLGQIPKSGFSDVVTLHAVVHPTQDESLVGRYCAAASRA
jgi:hypothetical protein